jgi:transcriptional regulator with XRE-family HTH domain
MTDFHICQGKKCHNVIGDIMDNNLKKLRKSRRLTQIAVQIATGIDQGLLSKYENGCRTPTTENLLLLADFYHVSLDYLLCRTDNPAINR